MQRVAILGSGFGLYGYMPAVLKAGAECVILPGRYREKFASRAELAPFSSQIEWAADEAAALENADSAVIALMPDLQAKWAQACIDRKNITHLLLEKPLASCASASLALFNDLMRSGKRFRIGYMFRFTPWGEALAASLKHASRSDGGALQVSWQFMAHHFRHHLPNWKRFDAQGGGAIRFYGIHLVAFLGECGYDTVLSSVASGYEEGVTARWQAYCTGPGLPQCSITVDCHAETARFHVAHTANGAPQAVCDRGDPFDDNGAQPVHGGLDKRIPLLVRLCESLQKDTPGIYAGYANGLQLWAQVERCTQREAAPCKE